MTGVFAGSSRAAAGTLEKLDALKLYATDWTYIARAKGLFKSFEDQGIKVELVEGYLGNEVQLIERGDLHFASRMIYPFLLYKTQGADLKAVQVSKHPEPNIISILVKRDSPYKTFDDLKGKKICSWRAGCPYIGVFEIAEARGWKQGTDWEYINVPSAEQVSALLSGEVDAVSVHLLAESANLLAAGEVREIANVAPDSVYVNGGGVTVVFTGAKFADGYPGVTKEVLRLKRETESWILANRDEAAAALEGITRVPASASKTSWERMGSTWADSALSFEEIVGEAKNLQDWLIAHSDIAAGKAVNPRDLFDADFFQ
jgi:ABC-type nitrate/sulfonate/bicarbonate transport system substrate-binding protein